MKRLWLKTRNSLVVLSQFREFHIKQETEEGKLVWKLTGVPWPPDGQSDPLMTSAERCLVTSRVQDDVAKVLRQIQNLIGHDDKIIVFES